LGRANAKSNDADTLSFTFVQANLREPNR
jgi:hypothetical protein